MYKYKNYIQRNIRWKFILYGKYPYIWGILLVAKVNSMEGFCLRKMNKQNRKSKKKPV